MKKSDNGVKAKLTGDNSDDNQSSQSSFSSSQSSEVDSDFSVGYEDLAKLKTSPRKTEFKLQCKVSQSDCDNMIAEMNKELSKRKHNYNQLKCILESTFRNRCEMMEEWEQKKEPMVSLAVDKWPAFKEGYFVSIIWLFSMDLQLLISF